MWFPRALGVMYFAILDPNVSISVQADIVVIVGQVNNLSLIGHEACAHEPQCLNKFAALKHDPAAVGCFVKIFILRLEYKS